MTDEYLQFGAVAVIFLFAIKEFFAWMRARKENGTSGITPAEREINRRFDEVHGQISGLVKQTDNHIHTIESKVETLSNNIIEMGKEITKLATIVEERMPKK
jgi:hypothetical protein